MKKKTIMKAVMLLIIANFFQGMIMPVYAADMAFTDCSKLVEAVAAVDATEQPVSSSKIIHTFEEGAPMMVTGESQDGWYRITFQGKDGYVKKETVKTAPQTEGESLEALNRELDETKQTNKIIVEEVERMRAEQKRSRVWTVVIVLLIAGIFGVGIYSTIKANREEEDANGDESIDIDTYKEAEMEDFILQRKKTAVPDEKLDIIDLDKTDIEDIV